MKRLFTGGRVWHSDHTFRDNCPILIDGETILAVGAECNDCAADDVVDVTGMTVLPGLVDVHTH